jgi:hypothetical protein
MSQKKSLSDSEIVTESRVSRRGAIGIIGASLAGVAIAAVVSAPTSAKAQTDTDSGANADRAGGGRTGGTDSDTGANADRGGHGSTGRTDSDTGANADRAGRGGTGNTDSDTGAQADRAGRGR